MNAAGTHQDGALLAKRGYRVAHPDESFALAEPSAARADPP